MAGEGYAMLFAFFAFGLPMIVWSAGMEWAGKNNFRGLLVLAGAGLAFAIGVIITSYIYGFIEG